MMRIRCAGAALAFLPGRPMVSRQLAHNLNTTTSVSTSSWLSPLNKAKVLKRSLSFISCSVFFNRILLQSYLAPDLPFGAVSPAHLQLLIANFSIHLGMAGQCGLSPVDTPFTERGQTERKKLGGKVGRNQRGSCFFLLLRPWGCLRVVHP